MIWLQTVPLKSAGSDSCLGWGPAAHHILPLVAGCRTPHLYLHCMSLHIDTTCSSLTHSEAICTYISYIIYCFCWKRLKAYCKGSKNHNNGHHISPTITKTSTSVFIAISVSVTATVQREECCHPVTTKASSQKIELVIVTRGNILLWWVNQVY